ncbi:MAG: phospholipase D-like domain-containing protein [Lachnospiraceae bacterium]
MHGIFETNRHGCIFLGTLSASGLRLAAKKGVDVRIITPHIPDKKTIFLMTRSSYERLIGDGVKIYEYTPGFIHAKNIVCDDKFAVCGTINLDYRSLVHHYECGVWMYHVECIRDMKEDFEETLKQSEQINELGAKLKG